MEETFSISAALKERLASAAVNGENQSMVNVLGNGIDIQLDNFEIGTGLPYAEVKKTGIPLDKVVKAVVDTKAADKTAKKEEKKDAKAAKKEEKKDEKAAKKDDKPAKKEEKKDAAKKDESKK